MLSDLSPLEPFLTSQNAPPAPAIEVMVLCLFDWAICGLGAKDDPISQSMSTYALGSGAGVCSIFSPPTGLGWSGRTSARTAALINGTTSHALDFDDTHFAHIGHVSTVVIPAALAVAETEGCDFETFLRAARIGAEVATRVGLWLGRSHYQAGWHQTATSGAFGAAAASAILMGAPVTPTLLNVAGFAAGQKAQFGSAMKPVNAGMAAANGVEAAQLATAGLCGSADVIPALLATHSGQGDITAFNGLGEDWIFDTVSHKYHACCHGTHAMIEALLSLLPLEADDIAGITIRTHSRWLSVCNKPAPTTGLEGKFSYAFLAAMFIDGGRTFGSEPDRYFPLRDDMTSLMARVTVAGDASVAETASDVMITLKNGATRHARYDLATPEPLGLRKRKLQDKSAHLVSPSIVQDLSTAIAARDLAAFTRAVRQSD